MATYLNMQWLFDCLEPQSMCHDLKCGLSKTLIDLYSDIKWCRCSYLQLRIRTFKGIGINNTSVIMAKICTELKGYFKLSNNYWANSFVVHLKVIFLLIIKIRPLVSTSTCLKFCNCKNGSLIRLGLDIATERRGTGIVESEDQGGHRLTERISVW